MLPRVFLVKQDIRHRVIADPAAVVADEMQRCLDSGLVKPGQRVAVACGSRGITHVPAMAKAVVDALKSAGARPFVFPAMGSHGGGTSEGQKSTLEHLGLTEAFLDCPILSEIEPQRIGETHEGVPVYMDVNALEADWIMVLNRVKPHSDFFGTIGSGLVKMLVIGCGKMKGADTTHEAAIAHGLEPMLRSVAETVLEKMPVLGALGVIEGPTGLTETITWSPADDLIQTEPERFSRSCRLAPAIPIKRATLLVVDWMGKNISGCGIDPFVIGRQEYLNVHDSYTDFRADRLYVADMTEESLGNADGVGMADATSRRLVSKLDYDAIRLGVMTSRTLPLGRIPIFFESDRDAIEHLLVTGTVPRRDATVIRIRNTTDLEYLEISENLLGEWEALALGPVVSGPSEPRFDDSGNLLPLPTASWTA